jgi:hypothetical protein
MEQGVFCSYIEEKLPLCHFGIVDDLLQSG